MTNVIKCKLSNRQKATRVTVATTAAMVSPGLPDFHRPATAANTFRSLDHRDRRGHLDRLVCHSWARKAKTEWRHAPLDDRVRKNFGYGY